MFDLERIISGLFANEVSTFFSSAILAYLCFSIVSLFGKKPSGKLAALTEMSPSVLTSLGILGTFLGIFLGLIDFDFRTVNKSVPELLEGLKVAFGTSILGLGSALIFRVARPLISSGAQETGASAEDILRSLNDLNSQMANLNTNVEETNKTSKDGFDSLKNALTDDSDSSVAGQLQRLRASFSDLEKATVHGFEAQIKEFREFAEHMSKAFSEAIIEELKSVIREFNEKISEQFGDNFKQLNEAVGRLLEWQENYRQQLEQLKASFDKSVEAVSATEKAIVEIEKATSAIPEHTAKFSEANDQLIEQLTLLHQGLGSVAEMRDRAEGAIPEISSRIEEMTQTISGAVENQKEATEAIKDVVQTSTAELQKSVETISGQIESSIGEQREAQQQMLDGLQSALNETLQNATNQLNDAIVQLDEAMQNEIESVVRTMAESLSGIAQKFVDDYAPLLEQTRQIVEIGKRAKD